MKPVPAGQTMVLQVVEIKGNVVRLGLDFSESIQILREEVEER